MAELDLYEPINVLKPVARDIWIVDGPLVSMAYLGTKLPFTTRMTVIRLASGELFLHSPIRFDEQLASQLEQLGRVKHLVSPNRIHYEGMVGWKSRYPDAINWASPGVRERAESQGISIEFDRDLLETAPKEWSEDIDQIIVPGSKLLTEVVFCHRPSKTVILTDLIENFELPKIHGPVLKFLTKMSGATDPDGKAPIDMRMTFLGGRKSAAAAIRRVIAWEPDRVIIAHGKWYPKNGTQELHRAFRWLL